jgi:hypothetical protein
LRPPVDPFRSGRRCSSHRSGHEFREFHGPKAGLIRTPVPIGRVGATAARFRMPFGGAAHVEPTCSQLPGLTDLEHRRRRIAAAPFRSEATLASSTRSMETGA